MAIFWEWFNPGRSQTQANLLEWDQAADFYFRPPTLTAGNFKAPWHTDLILTLLKDLNLLKNYTKNQEAGQNVRLSFTLSSRPHFVIIYLVRVPCLTSIAVCEKLFSKTIVCIVWDTLKKKILNFEFLKSGLRYQHQIFTTC